VTTTDLADLLGRFDPVGLDELTAAADLQTRQDRKYLVPLAGLSSLVETLGPSTRILAIDELRRFRYRSTYFDTQRRQSYFDAARRRPSRFKVRTRHYVDTGHCMLEVKTRDRRGLTVKHREHCEPLEEADLSAAGRRFVESIAATVDAASHLTPALTVTYDRSTFLLAGSRVRVTIDTDLTWHGPNGRCLTLGPVALVETKTDGRLCVVDRSLWKAGHRPTTISKYCTGLAALYPHLPSNKWNRVLRQYLDWRPDRTNVVRAQRSDTSLTHP
jgi:hypothetical protein